eukprot:XP_001690918.1 predicted protein [Chlamydomonas reinhardtii]
MSRVWGYYPRSTGRLAQWASARPFSGLGRLLAVTIMLMLNDYAFAAVSDSSVSVELAFEASFSRCLVHAASDGGGPPPYGAVTLVPPRTHPVCDAQPIRIVAPVISSVLPLVSAMMDAIIGSDVFGPASHHSYVMPATALADIVERGRWPADLSALTGDDPDLDWRGILPLYREVLAVYDGKVYGLPFNGIMQVMYYRRDLFEAAGLPPPRTWAEVLAAAARFNGTDLDGDGVANDYGVCIWQPADCERFAMPLTTLLASLVQARGRNSGLQMDPETGKMAHNTVAWEVALQLLRNLSMFAPPPLPLMTSTTRDCFILTHFGEGRCAMAFTMAGVFKAYSHVANTASKVRGRMGVTPLPGSPHVLDWGRNELVPCTYDRCPFAVSYGQPEDVQQYLAQRSEQQRQQQAAASGGLSLLLNSKFSTVQQVAAYSIMVAMMRNAATFAAVMSTTSSDGPSRTEHLDPANEGRWIAAGFHPNDTAQFLLATRESVASSNTAIDIRALYGRQHLRASSLTAIMIANHTIPLAVVVRASRSLMDQIFTPAAMPVALASYRASIRYINTSAAAPPAPASISAETGSAAQRESMQDVAVGVAVACVVTLLALGTYTWWWTARRRRRGPRDGGGRILAPGVGEDTSLVVTDIMDSTRLWEELPSAVMDVALQLHHSCIRRVSTACSGYESATGRGVVLPGGSGRARWPGLAARTAAARQVLNPLSRTFRRQALPGAGSSVRLPTGTSARSATGGGGVTADSIHDVMLSAGSAFSEGYPLGPPDSRTAAGAGTQSGGSDAELELAQTTAAAPDDGMATRSSGTGMLIGARVSRGGAEGAAGERTQSDRKFIDLRLVGRGGGALSRSFAAVKRHGTALSRLATGVLRGVGGGSATTDTAGGAAGGTGGELWAFMHFRMPPSIIPSRASAAAAATAEAAGDSAAAARYSGERQRQPQLPSRLEQLAFGSGDGSGGSGREGAYYEGAGRGRSRAMLQIGGGGTSGSDVDGAAGVGPALSPSPTGAVSALAGFASGQQPSPAAVHGAAAASSCSTGADVAGPSSAVHAQHFTPASPAAISPFRSLSQGYGRQQPMSGGSSRRRGFRALSPLAPASAGLVGVGAAQASASAGTAARALLLSGRGTTSVDLGCWGPGGGDAAHQALPVGPIAAAALAAAAPVAPAMCGDSTGDAAGFMTSRGQPALVDDEAPTAAALDAFMLPLPSAALFEDHTAGASGALSSRMAVGTLDMSTAHSVRVSRMEGAGADRAGSDQALPVLSGSHLNPKSSQGYLQPHATLVVAPATAGAATGVADCVEAGLLRFVSKIASRPATSVQTLGLPAAGRRGADGGTAASAVMGVVGSSGIGALLRQRFLFTVDGLVDAWMVHQRMGVASGVRLESDITLNRASQRITYAGRTMAIAKAISGAAAGGMVLVSAEAHALLTGTAPGEALGPAGSTSAAAAAGVPRWAALPLPAAGKPPASCVAAGVLAAPVGQLAVAVVAVSGAAAIAASSFGVWRQSATLLWREAARLALAHSGFLATTRSAVVAAAGCDAGPTAVGLKAAGAGGSGHTVLLTAAFPSAVAAMRWSAALLEWGLLAPWPAALLLHDCAEEIWRDTLPGAAAGTAGAGTVTAQGGFGARVCVAADAAGAAAATMQPLPLTLEPASLQSQGALLSGSAVHVAALRMATGLPSAQRSSSSGLPPQAVGGVTHTALPHAGAAGGTPSQPSRASLLGVAAASSGMLAAPPLALLVEGGADQGRNVLMSESALELPRNLHGVPPSDKIRPASGHVAHASSGSHSRGGARVRGLCLDAVGGEPIRSNVHTSPSASTHLTAATSSSAHCSTHSSSGHAGGSGRTGGGSGGRVSGFSAAAHGRMRPPTVLEVSPSLIPAGLEHHFMGGDVSSGAEGGVVPPPRMVLAVGRPRHAYPDAGSSAAAASPGTQMSDRGPGHRTSVVDITLAAQPVRSITAAPDYPTSQSEPQSQQPAACADASSAQQTAGGGEGGGTGATDQSQAEAGSYRPGALRTVTQSGCITSAHTVASTLSSTADGEGPGLHAAAATASGPAASQPTQPPQLPHHPQQSSIQGNNSVAATGPRAAVPAAVVDLDGRGQVGEIGLLPPPRPMRTSAIGSLPTCSSVQGGGGSSQVGFNKDSDGGVMLASEYLPFFLCRGLRLRCGVDYGVVTADVNCVTGVVQYRGPIAVAAAALAARAPVSQALVSSAAATAASAAVAAEAAILAEDSISKARVLASPESVYLAGRQPALPFLGLEDCSEVGKELALAGVMVAAACGEPVLTGAAYGVVFGVMTLLVVNKAYCQIAGVFAYAEARLEVLDCYYIS